MVDLPHQNTLLLQPLALPVILFFAVRDVLHHLREYRSASLMPVHQGEDANRKEPRPIFAHMPPLTLRATFSQHLCQFAFWLAKFNILWSEYNRAALADRFAFFPAEQPRRSGIPTEDRAFT